MFRGIAALALIQATMARTGTTPANARLWLGGFDRSDGRVSDTLYLRCRTESALGSDEGVRQKISDGVVLIRQDRDPDTQLPLDPEVSGLIRRLNNRRRDRLGSTTGITVSLRIAIGDTDMDTCEPSGLAVVEDSAAAADLTGNREWAVSSQLLTESQFDSTNRNRRLVKDGVYAIFSSTDLQDELANPVELPFACCQLEQVSKRTYD